MSTIVITGWNQGLDKIALTRTIRQHTGLGLDQSKQCTDEVLEGKPVAFKHLSQSTAAVFLREVRAIGATGEIREEDT